MKGGDVSVLVTILVLLLIAACMGCYTFAHTNGYEKGAKHAQLYYEQVGGFPSEDWYYYTEARHLEDGRDIQDTLERYKPTEYGR